MDKRSINMIITLLMLGIYMPLGGVAGVIASEQPVKGIAMLFLLLLSIPLLVTTTNSIVNTYLRKGNNNE